MASIISAGTTTGTAIAISGDTTGDLAFQTKAGVNTITVPNVTGTMMVNGPAFSAYLNSSQTVSTATWTKVQFNLEEFDTNNCYDTTTFRFTPTVAGYYQFSGSVGVLTTQTGIALFWYKNGSQFKQTQNTGNASTSTTAGSCLIYCNGTTDYVELYVYLNSGQGLQNSSLITYMQAVMVRGA